MDLEEIKNLIKKDTGKFIIVENGEPILMIMSFKDYKKLVGGYKREVRNEETKESQEEKAEEFNSENESQYSEQVEQGESLNIEDLPV